MLVGLGKAGAAGRKGLQGISGSGLRFKDVLEGFDYLLGGGAPCLRPGIYFFQRVNDIFTVQGDVGLGECGAVARIKRGVPLFVFVAEAHDD